MNEKLLIVEDEETLCESLKRVLSREGYSVDSVSNAEEAFDALEKKNYDLALTDIILPGITGIELIKRFRGKKPELLFVVMTAYASLETAVEALRAGAYDYIVKPVMHEEIRQVVRNALDHKSPRKED
ncbi:MAG: response regulator [Nitrospirae bacterium]|nr:response regulator [Nitrospirota bacterium]